MAIKVNGTTVINDSRQLQNVASVDATTVAALGAAGVGGGAPLPPEWDPTVTPDVTFSSSGTWNKPAGLADDVWVIFYAVGGGAAGTPGFYCHGGGGGAATIVAGLVGSLPSSITITVAATRTLSYNNGNDTIMSISGKSISARGGLYGTGTSPKGPQEGIVVMPAPANPFAYYPSATEVEGGPGSVRNDPHPRPTTVYGAAGGGGGNSNSPNGDAGGVSTYAGNGGKGYYNTAGQNGFVPGGGGGGSGGNNGDGHGAAGSVRIYYLD